MVWLAGLDRNPNRAIAQRVRYLQQLFDLRLYTLEDADIPPDLVPPARVRRLSEFAGLIRLQDHLQSEVGKAAVEVLRYVLRVVYVCAVLAREEHLCRTIVYTIGNREALIGLMARCLGAAWVADITDMPDALIEQLPRQRAGGRRGILAVFLYRFVYNIPRVFQGVSLAFSIGTSSEWGWPSRLAREFRVPIGKIVPVPNGVNLEETVETPTLPHAGLRLGYAGPIDSVRGGEVILGGCSHSRRPRRAGRILSDRIGPPEQSKTVRRAGHCHQHHGPA
ncbi:MAG: hypothetical protein M1118_12405 [Chloroflexi bacterium]|nr:hypothetical protein [Chloroflexota bacterium]